MENEAKDRGGESAKSLSPTQIKVFRINEYEWWAAETLQDAIKACCEECDLPEDEAANEPYELTAEQLDTHLMFECDNDFEEEHQPKDGTPTFRECLDFKIRHGHKFPCMFATTEW